MHRKKILWVNEFSLLSTGYAVYGKEILSRLYKLDKYDIAELALYVSTSDPRIQNVPWKVYANAPEPHQKEQIEQYRNNPVCDFGAARFEEIVLDFKPDIVISVMDPWMFEHISNSPLRRLFNLILMPTVDSDPQQQQWLNMFMNADSLFTYSDYGLKTLEHEADDLIELLGSASPGADPEAFQPVDNKAKLKESLGLRKGVNIIGTVMRNQKRKLYPEILNSYQIFVDKCIQNGNASLARDTLLYFHLTFPDVGWDIPELLKRSGLGHRVLFTYSCRECGNVFASFFQGPRTFCTRCNKFEAGMPSTQNGIDDKVLGQIMNVFDLYIQYSISEGFGMPQLEAAACGVPVMSTDHSAMGDVVRKIKGTPIRIKHTFLEPETKAYRVYPDNNHLAEEIYKFLSLPEPIKRKKSQDTLLAYKANYGYDKTAKKWEEAIDNLKSKELWNSPPRINQPVTQLPDNMSNGQFVPWALENILGEPERRGSYLHLKLVKDLNYGAFIPGFGGAYLSEDSTVGAKPIWQVFNRENAAQILFNMAQTRNYWESRRVGLASAPQLDYIEKSKKDIKHLDQ